MAGVSNDPSRHMRCMLLRVNGLLEEMAKVELRTFRVIENDQI